MEHGLFVDGELIDTHENQRFLQALADAFDAPAQVVTLRQPATGAERQMYAIVAYMARCPNAGVLELCREFSMEVGEMQSTIDMLGRAGLITQAVLEAVA